MTSSARSLRSEIICGIGGRRQHNVEEVDVGLPPHLKPATRLTRQRRPSCDSTYSLSTSSAFSKFRRGSVPPEELPTTPSRIRRTESRFRLKSKSLDRGESVGSLRLHGPRHRRSAYRSHESLVGGLRSDGLNVGSARKVVAGSEFREENNVNELKGKEKITGTQEKTDGEIESEKKADVEGLQAEQVIEKSPEKSELTNNKKKFGDSSPEGQNAHKSPKKSGAHNVEEKTEDKHQDKKLDEAQESTKLGKSQKKLDARKSSKPERKGSHKIKKSDKVQDYNNILEISHEYQDLSKADDKVGKLQEKVRVSESKEAGEENQQVQTAEESKEAGKEEETEEAPDESTKGTQKEQKEELAEESREGEDKQEESVEDSNNKAQEEQIEQTAEGSKEEVQEQKEEAAEELREAAEGFKEVAQGEQEKEAAEESNKAAEEQKGQTAEESKEATEEKEKEEAGGGESVETAQDQAPAEESQEAQTTQGEETSDESKEATQVEQKAEEPKETAQEEQTEETGVESQEKANVNKPEKEEEEVQVPKKTDGELQEKVNVDAPEGDDKSDKQQDDLSVGESQEAKLDKTNGETATNEVHKELKAKKSKIPKGKKLKPQGADVSNEAEASLGNDVKPKKTAKKQSTLEQNDRKQKSLAERKVPKINVSEKVASDSDDTAKNLSNKEGLLGEQEAQPSASPTDSTETHRINFEVIIQENALGDYNWTKSHEKLYYPKKKRRGVKKISKREYHSDEEINKDKKEMASHDWSHGTSLGRNTKGRYAGHKRVQYRSIGNDLSTAGYCPRCDPNPEKKPRKVKRRIFKSASLNNLSSTKDGADDEVEVKRPPFNGMEEKRYRAIMDEIQALMDEVQRQRDEFRNELRVLATCLDNNRQHQASDSTNEDELVDALGEGEEQMSAAQETSAEVKEKKPEDEAQPEKQKEDEKELKEEESKEEGKDEGGSRTPSTSATPEPRGQENGDDAPGTPKQLTLREQFRNFSKFGDIKSDGKLLTLSQSDKWFKQAKVIDGKSITTTDTAITFNKLKSKKITFVEFEKYLDEISKSKKIDVKDLKTKLRDCGAPGTSGTTSVVKSSAVDRLTDTKKFTGSHKLRFDSTGRGRGIAGRRDVNDGSGYVTGYKNKNTYDKTH